MTIYEARRARDPDPRKDIWGPRILCGHRWGVNYCAAGPIAYVAPFGKPPVVVIRAGLAEDPETPGLWHASTHAASRLARGQTFPGGWRHGGAWDQRPAQFSNVRSAALPAIIPCQRGHYNRIDVRLAGRHNEPDNSGEKLPD